jgi:hypothetical protein
MGVEQGVGKGYYLLYTCLSLNLTINTSTFKDVPVSAEGHRHLRKYKKNSQRVQHISAATKHHKRTVDFSRQCSVDMRKCCAIW